MILGFIRQNVARLSASTETLLDSFNREVRPILSDLVVRWNRLADDTLKATDVSSSSGELSIDFSARSKQRITLTENVTSIVLTAPKTEDASGLAAELMLIVEQTGAFTIAGWPANVSWVEGSSPDITEDFGVIGLVWDGASYIGCKYGSLAAGGVTFGSPVALTVGGANVDGTGGDAARADHEHQIQKGSPLALAVGAAASDGSSGNFSDADHKHATPKGSPVALTVGGANVDGSSGNFADASHKHSLPAFGTSAGDFAEGNHTHAGLGSGYFDTFLPDAPPSSAHSHDDECGGNSIAAGWTQYDPAGYATFTAVPTEGRYRFSCTGNGNNRNAGLYRAIPASEFSAVAKLSIETIQNISNAYAIGLFVAEDLATVPTTADWREGVIKGAGALVGNSVTVQTRTAYNAAPTGVAVFADGSAASHIRIRANGTTVAFDWSHDGISFYQLNSAVSAFTPVVYGVFFYSIINTQVATFWLDWFRVQSGAGTSAIGANRPGRLARVALA